MLTTALINSNHEINFSTDEKTPIEILSQDGNNIILSQDGKTYKARVLDIDTENKEVVLKINGSRMHVKLTNEFDNLLLSLGMDASSNQQINELKAPMPGVVISVLVKEGDKVEVNTPLVILEAMKMENMLKSPAEGVVKSISILKGETVEKGKVLVTFE